MLNFTRTTAARLSGYNEADFWQQFKTLPSSSLGTVLGKALIIQPTSHSGSRISGLK